MNILGISAFYHDSAACLVQDGRIVGAAQEERFTRVRHDPRFPREAIVSCLALGGVDLAELDLIAFYEKHFPRELRFVLRQPRKFEIHDYMKTLSRHGWLAPAWPRRWGGMELSPAKQLILFEERERISRGKKLSVTLRELALRIAVNDSPEPVESHEAVLPAPAPEHRRADEDIELKLGRKLTYARQGGADRVRAGGCGMRLETHYGKAEVSTYRTWATPLRGVRAIPESAWTGTENRLMAAEIDVRVLGETVRYAFVCDPDGNHIEISQRATLTGGRL